MIREGLELDITDTNRETKHMQDQQHPIAEARARCFDTRQAIMALYANYFRNLKQVGESYDHDELEAKADNANMDSQNHLQEALRIRTNPVLYNRPMGDRNAEQERDAALSRIEEIDQQIDWVREKLYDAESKMDQSLAGTYHADNIEILKEIERQYKKLQRREQALAELFSG